MAGENYGAGNFKATNGRLYKVSASGAGTPLAWYPAPGCRHYPSGALGFVADEGTVWSSAVSGINGMNLNFIMTWFSSSYVISRSRGHLLRCLSE